MRRLLSFALLTGCSALFLCVAGQASALPTLKLVYLGGATGSDTCTNGTDATLGQPGLGSGDCATAKPGDIVLFAIALTVDSGGMVQYSFDLRWDADGENEFDLFSHRERSALNLINDPGPPPSVMAFSVSPPSSVQESGAGSEGHIQGYSAVTTEINPPFPASLSFRVAVVALQVNGNVNRNGGVDIELGFFRAEGPSFGDGNLELVIPTFDWFSIDANTVPEPGTLVLVGLGVLALALSRRGGPRRF